jgi:hypothetical protein
MHKNLNEILTGTFFQPKYATDDGKPLPTTYKTWTLSKYVEKSETLKDIWDLIYKKSKAHLSAKNAHLMSINAFLKTIPATTQKQ